jgi:hypothetical protein
MESSSNTVRESNLNDFNKINHKDITILSVLKVKDTRFGILAMAVAFYSVSFFGGFLSVQIANQYKVDDKHMGYVFACLSAPYFLSCALLPALFAKVPAKLQFVICFILTGIAMGLLGPT